MNAFIFPGQGSQKEGMGKDLYDNFPKARLVFEQANEILKERFSDSLFKATEDILMDTRYTQMGIFLYEIALATSQELISPSCTAGHSLGEYAALVVAGALEFEECVLFIKKRGEIFYNAYQRHPSAMGAIIGVDESIVQEIIDKVTKEEADNLYIANYNGPGQIVITGGRDAVKKACKLLKNLGAKRAIVLPQTGVGHSPNSLEEGILLEEELKKLHWHQPNMPIYMDYDGLPHTDPQEILNNEILLMTNPVQWTKMVNNMINDGVTSFYECGTDDTLQKIVKRMCPNSINVTSLLSIPTYVNIIKDFSI